MEENKKDKSLADTDIASLVSRLSHDIRNPLATVQSFLHILELEDYKISPEELQEIAKSLKQSLSSSLDKIDEQLQELRKTLNISK